MIESAIITGSDGRVVFKVGNLADKVALANARFTTVEALFLGRALIDESEASESREHVLILDMDIDVERQKRDMLTKSMRMVIEKNDGQLTFEEVADLAALVKALEGLDSPGRASARIAGKQ